MKSPMVSSEAPYVTSWKDL